jgi:hypothetical protein
MLFLALSIPLFARIGETEDQCDNRYGKDFKPQKVDGGYIFYEMDKYKIMVKIRYGKCTMIQYTSKNGQITESAIKQLQSLNYQNPWLKPELNGVSVTITRSEDGNIFSTYESIGKSLQIVTKEEAEATVKELSDKDKKSLDGL